jgi:hypothetical protein
MIVLLNRVSIKVFVHKDHSLTIANVYDHIPESDAKVFHRLIVSYYEDSDCSCKKKKIKVNSEQIEIH